jgi:lysophospholipase L1-like esterase
MQEDLATFLLLGDSLTQLAFEGWGAQLAHVYQRRADVINRGCSGYNTEFYLRYMIDNLLPDGNQRRVSFVTIFFGANDASLPNENPHHHVRLDRYSQNLKTIIARVNEKYDNPKILLITPPPLDHEQRLRYQIQRYGDKATGILERTTENTQRYAEACRHVAAEMHVPCLDLFTHMLQQPEYGRFFCDGLHFSSQGHQFLGDLLLESICQHYPELAVTPDPITGQFNNSASHSALPSLGPYHDEIDHTKLD